MRQSLDQQTTFMRTIMPLTTRLTTRKRQFSEGWVKIGWGRGKSRASMHLNH
jgi:hypothetical protein